MNRPATSQQDRPVRRRQNKEMEGTAARVRVLHCQDNTLPPRSYQNQLFRLCRFPGLMQVAAPTIGGYCCCRFACFFIAEFL